MQRQSAKVCAAIVGLALASAGRLCTADDSASAVEDTSGALQEVVVTARRQNEDLEKVPVAVTALSRSALSEQNVTDEQELQTAVPGLLTVPSTSTNQLAFSIRGQALDAYSYTSPTVLAYFDEFQTGGITSTTFFDLQSVQVLKGPQGTLFGRNATGGAVLYTSTQPGQELTGYFDYTAGNFNEQKLEGAITIPLDSWASVRFASEDEHREGYERNVYLDLDEGSIDNRNFRATLLLTPLDALQNTTTLQYGRQGGDSGALKIVSANINCPPSPSCAGAELFPPGVPTGGVYPAKLASYNGLLNFIAMEGREPFWDVWNDSDDAHDAQLKEAVNRTTYAVNEDLSIKNIAGYNQVVSRDRLDLDGSPFEIATAGASGGPSEEGERYSTEQYSDELQLAGTVPTDRLNYLVGAYYLRDNEGDNVPLNIGCGSIAFPVTPENPQGCELPGGFRYNFENDEESRALFGQVTYEFIHDLRATAGYRETWEDIDFRYVDDGSVPEDVHQLTGVPLPPTLREQEPSWTLGLDYQLTPQTLLYVAQRGGFRVGGFNGGSVVQTSTGATNIDSYQPEFARDLELGIKYAARLGQFPVRVDADVYEERVRDAQRVVYYGISALTANAARTQTDGFELDALTDLTSWLQAGLDYAYTDTRYTDGTTHFTQVDAITDAIENISVILGPYGDVARNAGSVYLRIAHELPNSMGELVVRQDLYSQSSFYYSNLAASVNVPSNGIGPLDPNTKIGGYTLLNARIEWNDIAGSRFHAAAYVRNMLNKQYEIGGVGFGAAIGSDAVLLGTPRMAAVEIGLRF
ncbi:MAG TPA: TonB-dependent receptor [Steroidobacteraceae bacterium]|nr:TonB-dependent receptor [Steroidobacteraceae bacterium]